MTRVLVVGASPVVRAGLAALLEREGVVVVGVDDGAAGIGPVAASASVDVVVWAAPAAEAGPLATMPDTPAILALAPRRDAAWAAQALRAGVRGVLDPEPTPEEIVAAVDAVGRGLVVVAPDLAATLLRRSEPAYHGDAAPVDGTLLSPRELEILGWLAQGLANKQVAARLGLSEHTVKTHVAHVFGKLGVGTRAEAVARAARMGLLTL